MTWSPAEPGVYRTQPIVTPPISREELLKEGRLRYLAGNNKAGSHDDPQWMGAECRAAKGWLAGPHPPTFDGKVSWNGEEISVDVACRFLGSAW